MNITTRLRFGSLVVLLWAFFAPISGSASDASPDNKIADVLLFAGEGAWQPEVLALIEILNQHTLRYTAVDAADLNAMKLDDIAGFRAIVWPGGTGDVQTNNLSTSTKLNLRTAVQERGVSWLGFCAGAFVAVGPAPKLGPSPRNDTAYGLSIVDGPLLRYYYLEEQFVQMGREHQDWAVVDYKFADGHTRSMLWYGGPVTPEVAGGVVARYPTGEPAVTQLHDGLSFVLLVSGHPAAPDYVINEFGLHDPDGNDRDLAWRFIQAAVTRTPLPAF